jgi:hypothetical protein
MKNIFVIEPFADGLKTVKAYLSENNYQYSEFGSLDKALKSGEVPALLVLLADRVHESFLNDISLLKQHAPFSKVPRIFILPYATARMTQHPDLVDGQSSFRLPVEKLRFLSVVAKCLDRSPRRVFRIIITIQQHGSNIRYSGISIDFSETGMAFESTGDFAVGQEVTVNFVNPRTRKRFVQQSTVARRASTQPGGSSFYGVMFQEMAEQNVNDLMKFISGED